jgi:hypothetical protein
MKAGQQKPDSAWKKIGPCLYRYVPSGVYYGLIKSSGKQIRQSLGTDDLPLARRKLQDMRRDIELTDPELARRTLEFQALQSRGSAYLQTIGEGSRSLCWNGPSSSVGIVERNPGALRSFPRCRSRRNLMKSGYSPRPASPAGRPDPGRASTEFKASPSSPINRGRA